MTRRPPGYESALISKVPEAALNAIRGLKESRRWPLLLTGNVGAGKTCAAACLYGAYSRMPMWHRADDLLLGMATGRTDGIFVDVKNELNEVERRKLAFNTFVSRVGSTTCLFLDDLGTRRPTESMLQAMFDIMEYRKGKALVVTTNLSVQGIAELFDDRIADRFACGTIIKFEGDSRRERTQVVRV